MSRLRTAHHSSPLPAPRMSSPRYTPRILKRSVPPHFLQPPGRGPGHVPHDGPSGGLPSLRTGFARFARAAALPSSLWLGDSPLRGQTAVRHASAHAQFPRAARTQTLVPETLQDGPQSGTSGSCGNSYVGSREDLPDGSGPPASAPARWEVCHLPTACPRPQSRTSFS